MSQLHIGDMATTPHGRRLYEVMGFDTYPNGDKRASIREIGTGNPPIPYPANFLTYAGRF